MTSKPKDPGTKVMKVKKPPEPDRWSVLAEQKRILKDLKTLRKNWR